MPENDGVRVVLPRSYEFAEPASEARFVGIPSGPVALGGTSPSAEESVVLQGLADAQLEVVHTVRALPTADSMTRHATGPLDDYLEIEVDLKPDEEAALLLEQDGVYAWKTNGVEKTGAIALDRGMVGLRTVSFSIQIDPEMRAGQRSLQSFLFGPIKTFVLKFVAKKAVGAIAAHLEAHVHRG